MKRLFAFLLALAMLFSMAACGGNSDSEKSGEANGGAVGHDGKASAGYKSFDDLTIEWDLDSDYLLYADDAEGELYLRCDTPEDFALDPSVYGFIISHAEYGAVIVSSGEYTPGLTVEDAFSDVYRDRFIRTLDDYDDNSDWMEFTPDTTKKMTINDRDAIQFSGVQNAEDYATPYKYTVYGYCTVIENVPVVIAAVAGSADMDYQKSTQSEDEMVTIKHYTDEMIYTLRALDHYEEYGTH